MPGGVGEKVAVLIGDRRLTFGEVVEGWREDGRFRAFFLAILDQTPAADFFWETPPIGRGALDRPYEHVAIDARGALAGRASSAAFRAALRPASGSVVSFANLSGDATLVAPRPVLGRRGYGHLAAFLRSGPESQRHDLLITLAGAIDQWLQNSDRRLWVSTAGLGVPWLHVRLDSRPKYYQHEPYRSA